MTPPIYTLHQGTRPLLVSVPHAGQVVPADLAARMVPRAEGVEDTDWHLEKLYAFVVSLGASLIVPTYSRFVVDLNRPNDNQPMYPGVNNTELVPTRFFTGDAIYRDGEAPTEAEVRARCTKYWQPYHDAIEQELTRLHGAHGHAVILDGHSIRAEVPWLFEGRLPDLNLGTANGESCDAGLRAKLAQSLNAQAAFSHVVDGRFKGGHITRHYGKPSRGWHAVQMEMGWHTYADDKAMPPTWLPERARAVQGVLRELIEIMLTHRPS